jgi:hypothetical protein
VCARVCSVKDSESMCVWDIENEIVRVCVSWKAKRKRSVRVCVSVCVYLQMIEN